MGKIEDHRASNTKIKLVDALMSGYAIFSLKDSSLLAFDKRREEGEDNLKKIYGIKEIPSDSQLRNIIDEVEWEKLRPLFKNILEEVRRSGLLESYRYLGRYYILSVDGTGCFSSEEINCQNCLIRHNSKTGKARYEHKLLGAAIVHPEKKEVLALCPEPIIKKDGTEKNDCELNAAKRLFAKVREDYPYMPFLVVEDGLYANAPHIKMLRKHHLEFILLVKEGDHKYLFNYVKEAEREGKTRKHSFKEGKLEHRFHYINDVPLNESNQDVRVNFLEYWQISATETKHWCWVISLTISTHILDPLRRAGRARWKIENETFNTLKNQGYHYTHNYGHGQNNLATNFSLLMTLAFTVDQIQQLGYPIFQKALALAGSRKLLWERIRALFFVLPFASMSDILKALVYGYAIKGFVIKQTPL